MSNWSKKGHEQHIELLIEKKIQEAKATEKKGFFNKLAQSPVFVIISIIGTFIGAFGGVPGFKMLLEDTEFKFHSRGVLLGKGVRSTGIFLIGEVFNDGDKPLLVEGFNLKIFYDNKEIYGVPNRLSDSLIFKGENFYIKSSGLKESDLQIVGEIPAHKSISGNLLFTTTIEVNELINSERHYELICLDINGKEHSYAIKSRPSSGNIFRTYPKNGIEVLPMDSSFNSTDTQN
jgi:hypothetical protein